MSIFPAYYKDNNFQFLNIFYSSYREDHYNFLEKISELYCSFLTCYSVFFFQNLLIIVSAVKYFYQFFFYINLVINLLIFGLNKAYKHRMYKKVITYILRNRRNCY